MCHNFYHCTERHFLESCKSKPNFDCNYYFPIDIGPMEITIDAKFIGKGQLESKFGLDQQHSEKISLREVWKLSSEVIGG